MSKRNSKQKDLSIDQKIKYFGIFFLVVGLAYSFEVFFQTLLVNVICLTFLCVLVFMGMELYTRERVEFGGKLGVFKPIFNGFVYTMGFIFKSMYFHLRTRIIFAYNIIVLILPMIGLFYGWTANDFILITFLNVASSYIILWFLAVFGLGVPFKSRIRHFFGYPIVFFFFFIFLPLIGTSIFVSEGPSGLFTLTLNEQFYILLSEIALSSFSMVIALFYSKKKKSESEKETNTGNMFISYLMLALASVLILPFSSNFPELYTNHYLLCNCLLSAMLVFIVSLGDNFAFLPVFQGTKKGKEKRDKWFNEFDEFYNNKRATV